MSHLSIVSALTTYTAEASRQRKRICNQVLKQVFNKSAKPEQNAACYDEQETVEDGHCKALWDVDTEYGD